jgi:hypothetical protein
MGSTMVRIIAGVVVVLAAAGCGGTSGPTGVTAAPTSAAPTISATLEPTPVAATAAPLPSPTSAAPLLTGDAATNAACDLATVEEIQAEVQAGVKEVKGLTSPGAYAKNSLSCAWYLDSEEIGIPSVTVQWEFPVTTWHDPVVGLYESMVDQKLATRIEGVDDYAVLQGWTAEAVADERIVRVSVLLHVEATPEDQEKATTLLRLFLERTKPA